VHREVAGWVGRCGSEQAGGSQPARLPSVPKVGARAVGSVGKVQVREGKSVRPGGQTGRQARWCGRGGG